MLTSRPLLCVLVCGFVIGAGCGSAVEPQPEPRTHPSGDDVTFLQLSGRPHGVAVAAGGLFYVSRIDDASIMRGRLDGPGQSFQGAANVDLTPAHVALDPAGRRAYSANQFASSASVVDVASNQAIATIPLSGEGFNVLVSPSGDRVFVTTGSGTLHVIDAATNTSIDEIEVGAAANGLAYHAATNMLFVSSRDEALVTAIDALSLEVERSYTVSGMPQRIAVAPDGSELYIASEAVGLEILDLSTGERATVSGVVPGAVGLALSPDGVVLYVTNPPAGIVTVVDRESATALFALTGDWSPRNVAFDPIGEVAIIADELGLVVFVR